MNAKANVPQNATKCSNQKLMCGTLPLGHGLAHPCLAVLVETRVSLAVLSSNFIIVLSPFIVYHGCQ